MKTARILDQEHDTFGLEYDDTRGKKNITARCVPVVIPAQFSLINSARATSVDVRPSAFARGSKMNGEALLKTTSGAANSEARKNNRRCMGPLLYHLLVHLVTIE